MLHGSSCTPETAAQGLQQAVALGRTDARAGGDMQLPLLNLLALHDGTRQHESASRAAAFLVAATRSGPLPVAALGPSLILAAVPDASVVPCKRTLQRSSGAVRIVPNVQRPSGWWLAVRNPIRSGESPPLHVIYEAHARPGVLGARYLQARSHLLCRRWEEASRELQALLPLLPQLRCTLDSLGVSVVALLQQTVKGCFSADAGPIATWRS